MAVVDVQVNNTEDGDITETNTYTTPPEFQG